MANEKRLIDASEAMEYAQKVFSDPVLLYAIKTVLNNAPTVDAVDVGQYKALLDMYHELRENFIDYVCSGTSNLAPYCLNRCEGCVDRLGWCSQGSDECHGFNPAEIII